MCVALRPEEHEEDSLDQDMAQVGQHAFSRMEGDVDKQRRLILQGNLSDAAMQKQHQRKWVPQPPPTIASQHTSYLALPTQGSVEPNWLKKKCSANQK